MRTPHARLLAIVASALFALAGCSDDPDGTPEPDPDTGADTTEEDGGVDEDTSVEEDAGEDEDTGIEEDVIEVDAEEDVATGAPCESRDDCDGDDYCFNGFCNAGACSQGGDWTFCEELFLQNDIPDARYAVCRDGACATQCIIDQDCQEGELCTDFGHCRPSTSEFVGEQAGAGGDGTVRVGLSNVIWRYPVGVPMGGYGSRAASFDGRYAESLSASAGQMHGLYIRAAVLDSGDRQFLFIRIPAIFTGMAVHERVARALQEETGQQWRDNLIISSTHTHSGACRHWHLPEETAATIGSFGIGEFHQFFYDRIAESSIEAALAALDDLQPAQIGWEIIEGFDTNDQVGRDRWSATPPFDDNRVLLMRVDDMDDNPRAFLFSFGAHATDNDTDYITGDVIAGAERALEERLGEEYGQFVLTMFLNQNSGSMSPAGGVQGHRYPHSIERFGWAFTEAVIEDFMTLETSADLEIDAYNHRFPITYGLIGYAPNEFSGRVGRPLGGEYHFGGISCVGPDSDDRDYSTYMPSDNLNCVGALQFLLFNQTPTIMMRTHVLAGQFRQEGREPLTFVTSPGELAMELSWEMIRAMRDEFDLDPLNSWTFGYANDHLLYILPTNTRGERPPFPGLRLPHPDSPGRGEDGLPLMPGSPDDYPEFAFSYLQGGYESTMSPWGPRLGDYMVDRTVEAVGLMLEGDYEVSVPPALPVEYSFRDMGEFEIDDSDPAQVGNVTVPMPESVELMAPVEFAWIGGDPGAEDPQIPVVTLERETESGFEVVTMPSGMPYTNLEMRFMTRVRETDDDQYEWVVRWEELWDFPQGTYRLRVNGHYHDNGTRTPYETFSEPFDVVPTTALVGAATLSLSEVGGTLGYPPAERMFFLQERNDLGAVSGNFRMHDPMVPTGASAPVELENLESVTVTVRSGGDVVATFTDEELDIQTAPESRDGRDNVPTTRFSASLTTPLLPGNTFDVEVTFTDTWGHSGTTITTIEL